MFLLDGGNLMFGLAQTYPLAKSHHNAETAKQALNNVEPHLKALDGVILRVLRDTSLKILDDGARRRKERKRDHIPQEHFSELATERRRPCWEGDGRHSINDRDAAI
ncbi:hypothetical protein BD309DRAFT_852772 [Dichomitus squalens]|nr:hypothetical protein BD309DRAFT_852772 [Dichomitus squalens]